MVKLNIDTNNEFNVYKVGERTFQIGEINCEPTLKSSIIYILDKGFKFIPNYNLNPLLPLQQHHNSTYHLQEY